MPISAVEDRALGRRRRPSGEAPRARLSHTAFAAIIANVRGMFSERGFESGNARFQGSYALSKRKQALCPSKRALPNAKFSAHFLLPSARRKSAISLRTIDDDGVVTSLKEEHENSASRMFSNDRDCLAPHVHSRRAKGSVRPCRSEMTLDVESVVGGCVS